MIRKHFRLLYADWRREYRSDLLADLDAGLSWWEFVSLLLGLSSKSRWREVMSKEPVEVTGDAARALIDTM
ncbi:MAG TPA: Gp15 family bacteriophage protein [Actinokineospora sp.]|jgi:hypothetical protein|nr:Gp15 family bacteriophage protein [Actinokineospora sp.]